MREESVARLTLLNQQAAQNAVTTAFMQAQLQAMSQLKHKIVGNEKGLGEQQKSLDEHQKQGEDHEARLKKVEALVERSNKNFSTPNGEASARARAPIPIEAPALVPMPAPEPIPMPISMQTPAPLSIQAPALMPASAPIASLAPSASGTREPPGWSKLNMPHATC